MWGVKTCLGFRFLWPADVEAAALGAGFTMPTRTTRPPYAPEVEAQTTRCYMRAVRPAEVG